MILAVDIGGTSAKFGLVSPEHRDIIGYEKFDTRKVMEASKLESFLEEKIGVFLRNHPDIGGIGMGFPGLLTKDRKEILELPNIPEVGRLPIIDLLAEKFPGIPIRMENDAKCAALGEQRMGKYSGTRDFLLVTLGTGIGSGVIIDGKLFTGARGNGLELGHILTGREKTLEEQIGLKGFLTYAREQVMSRREETQLQPDRLSGKIIFEAAAQGDALAASLFAYLGTLLGEGLVAAVRLLDVTTILIGGGLSGAFDYIYPALAASMERHLPVYYTAELKVVPASLGNDAGLLGAASLMMPVTPRRIP